MLPVMITGALPGRSAEMFFTFGGGGFAGGGGGGGGGFAAFRNASTAAHTVAVHLADALSKVA